MVGTGSSGTVVPQMEGDTPEFHVVSTEDSPTSFNIERK